MPQRRGSLALSLLALVLSRGELRAQACPGPHARALPEDGAEGVPTNLQARLLFSEPTSTLYELGEGRRILAFETVPASEVTLLLRDEAGREVPSRSRSAPGAAQPLLLLEPAAPLAPHARYSLLARTAARTLTLSRFRTGSGPDALAPSARLERARLLRLELRRYGDPSGLRVELSLSGAEGVAGYELHELGPGEAPTEVTLRAVGLGSLGRAVHFGARSCLSSDLRFPPAGAPARWSLALVPFDLAGNRGEARPFVVDLAHPARR